MVLMGDSTTYRQPNSSKASQVYISSPDMLYAIPQSGCLQSRGSTFKNYSLYRTAVVLELCYPFPLIMQNPPESECRHRVSSNGVYMINAD